MVKKKKLPIGIESFEELRKEDFYYVDKTKLIEQLLMWKSESIYPSTSLWEIIEYEYASSFL